MQKVLKNYNKKCQKQAAAKKRGDGNWGAAAGTEQQLFLGKVKKMGKSKDGIYWLNTIITLLLMFGIGYLEPWGSLSVLGMKVLVFFLGMLWGWTTIGFVWPSMLGLLALGISGCKACRQLLEQDLGRPTIRSYVSFYSFLPLI